MVDVRGGSGANVIEPMTPSKLRILCVDDEKNVLEGLALQLERRYALETAVGGAAGLVVLEQKPDMAVIISDMRMPGMDGATFLARSRALAPRAVRMLLTGQTDIGSAVAAVNDGQIFRFLTKPCAPTTLLSAVSAAVEQHRLITAERELLELTLHGCIKALTDVLALTNPAAFGRASRLKTLAGALAAKLALPDAWQVEVAAMLSQLGHITLSSETAEKVYFGRQLSHDEQRQVDQLPAVVEQLLASIPRIEGVRKILSSYQKPPKPATSDALQVLLATEVLRVAVDFDHLESLGSSQSSALESMRARGDRYAQPVVNALATVRGGKPELIKELAPTELIVGMLLAEDVLLPNGMLLVARGHEVTPRLMERIRNLPKSTFKHTVRVTLRP